MKMRYSGLGAVALAIVACTSTGPGGGGDGGSDSSASTDGGVDSTTCSGMTTSGTLLCVNVLAALCTRRVSCCKSGTDPSFGGPLCGGSNTLNNCNCLGVDGASGTCKHQSTQSCGGSYCGDTCSQGSCEAWMAHDPKGHVCTDQKYANAQICSAASADCLNEIPSMPCSDLTGGTWNWQPRCLAFWAQFP